MKEHFKAHKKLFGTILGILGFVIIGFLVPIPEGLERGGMLAIGLVILSIIFIAFKNLPLWATGILMCIMAVLFKVAPIEVAFSSFVGTTFWLIVGILGMGAAIAKSGLIKRLSLKIMTLFPPTYNGMIAALLGVGTVFAPLMPSTTAKMAIIGPVAMGIGDTLGLEKRGKGMAGMFNAMYIGWSITGMVFLSASFFSPMMVGTLPESAQAGVSWVSWFVGMIPWALVIIIPSYFGLTRIYKPKESVTLTKDFMKKQVEDLGPMSRDEKVSLVILLVCVVLWVTEGIHGIELYIVALGGLVAFVATGVFAPDDFKSKISWDLIFFVGCLINMAPILQYNHFEAWLGRFIGPALSSLIVHPVALILALILIIYVVRLIYPDFIVTMVLISTILGPLVMAEGWNPWIIAVVAYCSVYTWTFIFQNGNALVAFAMCGGDAQNDFGKIKWGSIMYMVLNLAGMLVSIPYWKLLGYLP